MRDCEYDKKSNNYKIYQKGKINDFQISNIYRINSIQPNKRRKIAINYQDYLKNKKVTNLR